MRLITKRAAEWALVFTGLPSLGRWTLHRRALILAYHNVVPDVEAGRADAPLHLPLSVFREQLDILVEHHDVVPLDSLLTKGKARPSRPRVAITFDDAYRGAVTLGVTELAKRDLPATIFVAPHFVGGRTFWWDDFAGGESSGLSRDFRRIALEEYRGDDRAIREWAGGERGSDARSGAFRVTANEEELRAAATTPGLTLASHTWSHPNLGRLSSREVRDELEWPLNWLRDRFSAVVPWLSYPYGLHSEAVGKAAAASGYRAALRIEGGWLPAPLGDPFALPRLNVPAGLSAHGFRLRTAGLFCG